MKKITLFLFLLISCSLVIAAQTTSKSNPIYKVTVESDFDYVQDEDNPEHFDTVGTVQITAENRIITGLRFDRIKVRYYCNEDPNDKGLLAEGADVEYDYYLYDESGSEQVRKKSEVTKVVKTYDENGPCSGIYGGVKSSEVISVQFSQYKNTPFQHRVSCGGEQVEFAWAFIGNFKVFRLYTSKKIWTVKVDDLVKEYEEKKKHSQRQRVETQTGRLAPEQDLVVTINDKSISLKDDICEGKMPDPSAFGTFKAIMIHQMNQWGKACKKHPDLCRKKYEKTANPGGIRG